MSSDVKDAILIFSKSPELGTVKTRLQSFLTPQQCLNLHLAFLQDTVRKAQSVSPTVILYLTQDRSLPFSNSLDIRLQEGKDLGERLYHAFQECLKSYQKILVIGTDSPTFPPEILRTAFEALQNYELVLGPAKDGGYYLIGMASLIPEIFQNIEWGSSKVLASTLAAAVKRRVFLLEPYPDIDVPEDLLFLKREVLIANQSYLIHTRKWIEEWVRMNRPPMKGLL